MSVHVSPSCCRFFAMFSPELIFESCGQNRFKDKSGHMGRVWGLDGFYTHMIQSSSVFDLLMLNFPPLVGEAVLKLYVAGPA